MISQAKVRRILPTIIPIIILILVASLVLLPAQAAEPPEDIENLQQWVYDQGYNYQVAENWITQLPPEDREALCGSREIEAPEGPLPENLRFALENVPAIETGKVGQPPTYDAMALGYVTPIKNQGGCGSCWIFAATADFESDVAIGEATLFNFAEQEVGDCNIWYAVGSYDWCQGGNSLMTTNYFTKYGAADESSHPYAQTPQTCLNGPLLRSAEDWRWVTLGGGYTQITTIKNAILNYGPVYATIWASDALLAYSGGVYEDWAATSTNHAVQIIGWDDSLQHSQGTGAWMIKNSWATTWGASGPYPGCAWVAYGSARLGNSTSAICGYGNPPAEMFYHDECGWNGYVYGLGNPTDWGAVRFTPSQDETIYAVDFWAAWTGMSYEIKIFDTLTDQGGGDYSFSTQLGTTETGSTNEIGYYSVPLSTPVSRTSGDDFIVQAKLTNAGGSHPIPIDYHAIGWLPQIATWSDESYFSSDGTTFVKPQPYDVGIRARAEQLLPDLEITEKFEEWVDLGDKTYNIHYTVTNNGDGPAGASTVSVDVDGSETLVAVDPLDPDESWSDTRYSLTMPDDSDTISVCADTYNDVAESDEDNNCLQNVWPITGDINGDGRVNISDMVMVAQHWGQIGIPGWIAEDVKQDGVINVADMVLIAQNWTG